MSPQPWHGLSHNTAWSNVGDSYSDLARKSHNVHDTAEEAHLYSPHAVPAGVLSTAKPKGSGSFQLQSDWSLSTEAAGSTVYTTEATEKFKSPPANARPAESQAQKGKLSRFPQETYPSDFRTQKQVDFDAMRLIGSKRPTRAQRPTDSGIVLGVPASDVGLAQPRTVLSTVSLQQATPRLPLSDGTMRNSAGINLPSYNIITGEAPKHNDKSKFWSGQHMDYRRRR